MGLLRLQARHGSQVEVQRRCHAVRAEVPGEFPCERRADRALAHARSETLVTGFARRGLGGAVFRPLNDQPITMLMRTDRDAVSCFGETSVFHGIGRQFEENE